MTLTAMRPEAGLSKGREVSLWRVDLASSSISAFSVVVRVLQMFDEGAAGLTHFRCDFREPDGDLDSFDPAEEGADVAERMGTPVFEETFGFGGDLPIFRVGPSAPAVDVNAELVDDSGGLFVLLLGGGETGAFVEREALLLGFSFLPARFRDRSDEFGFTAGVDRFPGRLAGLVEFPVAERVIVGGIEDGVIEKRVTHSMQPVANTEVAVL